jgi:hypothetical protein
MTDTVNTTVEVDAELWRQLRAEGIRNGNSKDEQLDVVLSERYE